MNWIDLPLAWFVIDMATCCGFTMYVTQHCTLHIITYHRMKLLRHFLALQPLSLFAFPGLSNLMYM